MTVQKELSFRYVTKPYILIINTCMTEGSAREMGLAVVVTRWLYQMHRSKPFGTSSRVRDPSLGRCLMDLTPHLF